MELKLECLRIAKMLCDNQYGENDYSEKVLLNMFKMLYEHIESYSFSWDYFK